VHHTSGIKRGGRQSATFIGHSSTGWFRRDASLAVPRPGNPAEEGDDRQQECGVALWQETTAIGRQSGSRRTASAIVKRASIAIAMINRNAIACTQA
jgi:hypothetical protein